MLYTLIVFYSVVIVCTGENEENERRSSERTSEIGGRQNSIVLTHLILLPSESRIYRSAADKSMQLKYM